jgi:hypothetical protein
MAYPVCLISNCKNRALYVDITNLQLYPVRCEDHHLDSDIKLTQKICTECNNKLFFPEDKDKCCNCGQYRTKDIICFDETLVYDYLTLNSVTFIHNKVVSPFGSLYRPDFLIQSSFGYICLEVDEHQHYSYDKIQEETRMVTVYNDINIIKKDSQILFIRYNPNGYKGYKMDTQAQLSYLLSIINHFINLPTINICLCKVYLFYSGFDGNPKLEVMDINPKLN